MLFHLYNKYNNYINDIREYNIIVDNVKFYYLDNKIINDNRKILILFHGFQSEKNATFNTLIKQFDNKYRIIIPDLIEHGNTIVLTNKYIFDYKIDNQILYLHNFINKIIPNTNFNLIGTSIGGLLASYYITKYPLHINSITLLNTFGLYNDYTYKIFKKTGIHLLFPNNINELYITLYALSNKEPNLINKFIYNNVLTNYIIPKRMIHTLIYNNLIIPNVNLFNTYYNLINKPLNVIWGANDNITNIRDFLKIQHKLKFKPNINIIQKCKHTPHNEYPKICANIIKKYI